MQRDLDGKQLSPAQLSLVSKAAIHACDVVGGQHLGYIPDPSICRYDPIKDTDVLCADAGGNDPIDSCVTILEARAIDKIWYGITTDGNAPDPKSDNGFNTVPPGRQRWFALSRGTELGVLAGAKPFSIASDLVALELSDAKIAAAGFVNATGNGQDGWKALGYAELNKAFDAGVARQEDFPHINTDRPELYAFRDGGGKMLMYHGLSDILIPSQGSINYYNNVLQEMGGLEKVQAFYRLYLIPGMSHAFADGTANHEAVPPLPEHDELYLRLTQWVEKGQAPCRYDISAKSDSTHSAALCIYPQKPVFTGKDPLSAQSYECR